MYKVIGLNQFVYKQEVNMNRPGTKALIAEFGYEEIGEFSEGLAAVYDGDYFYHIHTNGRPAYSQRYSQVGHFSEGLARAQKGLWLFHIQHNGKPAYRRRFTDVQHFRNGTAMARVGDRHFKIRFDGSTVED